MRISITSIRSIASSTSASTTRHQQTSLARPTATSSSIRCLFGTTCTAKRVALIRSADQITFVGLAAFVSFAIAMNLAVSPNLNRFRFNVQFAAFTFAGSLPIIWRCGQLAVLVYHHFVVFVPFVRIEYSVFFASDHQMVQGVVNPIHRNGFQIGNRRIIVDQRHFVLSCFRHFETRLVLIVSFVVIIEQCDWRRVPCIFVIAMMVVFCVWLLIGFLMLGFVLIDPLNSQRFCFLSDAR
mmetsp:Transcript_56983/g.90796  ORF Transcript_56983/g.90796 Transcript_56983/m.90796 type:complete len:239 (-) Transcript_56983:553-1269(-)